MEDNQKKKPQLGQGITVKWLSLVPKRLRYLLLFVGLLLLVYMANKGIWF